MDLARHLEPLAARLYFIPRAASRLQAALNHRLRGYFAKAPGWVLLTTTGRRTGLPREVLLPCARSGGELVVISTYGWRSDWIRNLERNPRVKVICAGAVVEGRAELVEDLAQKRQIVADHPFFPPAPFTAVHIVALTVLRPLTVAALCWWVKARPVVVIRTTGGG